MFQGLAQVPDLVVLGGEPRQREVLASVPYRRISPQGRRADPGRTASCDRSQGGVTGHRPDREFPWPEPETARPVVAMMFSGTPATGR
ncbi:hypothetical protein ATKI12_8896 [Kitasatospora sp. Ki12]